MAVLVVLDLLDATREGEGKDSADEWNEDRLCPVTKESYSKTQSQSFFDAKPATLAQKVVVRTPQPVRKQQTPKARVASYALNASIGMGKSKKAKEKKPVQSPYSKAARQKRSKEQSRKSAPPPPQHPPTIPFESSNRILLVGEGDFSFAHSLLNGHGCTSILATCYDTRTGLLEKYPQAAALTKDLEAEEAVRVLYAVDATRLDRAGKEIRKGEFDRIVFNFPHVGGLTKDVNRQVRHNQELLVGFFRSAIPLLASLGSIVVTIFDGEPYELWNIRDLARHAGLKVERSFKFQASAYPGYKHARTLGNIKDGGGWKGEDRGARTYMFEVKDGVEPQVLHKKRNDESTDDEDD